MENVSTLSSRSPSGMDAGQERDRGTVRQLYARYGAQLGYLLAALAIYIGWAGRLERNITAENGLGYTLGILGTTLMVVLLLYPARKRLPFMRPIGATKHWFRGHMILGIIGPVVILFHCNFHLGDLNSKVALSCTLLVAASGIIGRYLYAKIHDGLYGRKASLAELVGRLQKSSGAAGQASAFVAAIRQQLAGLDQQVLTPPLTVLEGTLRPFSIGWRSRVLHRKLLRSTRHKLIAQSLSNAAVDQHAERLEEAVRRYLDDHMGQVREVARFGFYERLFSLWHVIHVPFFLIMVLSAIVHVVAVHLY